MFTVQQLITMAGGKSYPGGGKRSLIGAGIGLTGAKRHRYVYLRHTRSLSFAELRVGGETL